jgi:serine/threonine protein kinase
MAINYLHSNNIAHRDIKTDNVLINDKLMIKLIDFGFARQLSSPIDCLQVNFQFKRLKTNKNQEFSGTPCYLSPEIIQRKAYNPFKADVWAIGVFLFRIVTGICPFIGKYHKYFF